MKNLHNNIRKIFNYLFPPNDWKLIEVHKDQCLVDYSTDGIYEYTDLKDRVYYIYFSEYRSEYKLTAQGYGSTTSDMYVQLLQKTIELNKLFKV